MSRQGLILLAHGSRDAHWADPLRSICGLLGTARPDLEIELAFIEHTQPDLVAAGAALALRGCQSLSVVPMLLGVGMHARSDVDRLAQALRVASPSLDVHVLAPLGAWPDIHTTLACAIASAVAPRGL